MGGVPIPSPCFLEECVTVGAINGQKRWKSTDLKRIYTWDSLHGEIEVFNKRGKHLGVLTPDGNFKSGAIKGRTIDV